MGGGAAGLTAALVLGRCCRKVLVVDHGTPRNATTQAIHGFPTREGMAPAEWLRRTRAEVAHFGVDQCVDEVSSIQWKAGLFHAYTTSGMQWVARKVLLATGVRDTVPSIPGFSALHGRSVFHCPYCDAWEVRNKPLAAYGLRNRAVALALNLRNWSTDVILFTDGASGLHAPDRVKLAAAGVVVRTERVQALEGKGRQLHHVLLSNGERVARTALFYSNGHSMQCGLAASLGCRTGRTGAVATDRKQRTGVAGLYVAGDAAMDIHFVSVACAEGAKAAVYIHRELCIEDGLA